MSSDRLPSLGALFVVSAPSGGGKTSLSRAAVKRLATLDVRAEISVSYTTRTRRPGEEHGRHYHFVDDAEFLRMVADGEFLEHAEVFGRRYGTGRAQTAALLDEDCDVVLDIDWQGAAQVRAAADAAGGPEVVSVFILPPSLKTLEMRLHARAQDEVDTVRKRMAAARAEMAHFSDYDHLIINDDFDRALNELVSLFVARRLKRPLQQRRYRGLIDGLLG